jgi:hypothetical protein
MARRPPARTQPRPPALAQGVTSYVIGALCCFRRQELVPLAVRRRLRLHLSALRDAPAGHRCQGGECRSQLFLFVSLCLAAAPAAALGPVSDLLLAEMTELVPGGLTALHEGLLACAQCTAAPENRPTDWRAARSRRYALQLLGLRRNVPLWISDFSVATAPAALVGRCSGCRHTLTAARTLAQEARRISRFCLTWPSSSTGRCTRPLCRRLKTQSSTTCTRWALLHPQAWLQRLPTTQIPRCGRVSACAGVRGRAMNARCRRRPCSARTSWLHGER